MKASGDQFEELASQYLLEHGLRIVDRNFRCKVGEIDIIALHNEHLVFVEVRARSNARFAGAAASVDRRKQTKLVRSASMYLQMSPQWAAMACRFDVIAFEPRQSTSNNNIRWIRGAFSA